MITQIGTDRLEETISIIRGILTKALEENRQITVQMSRETIEMPSENQYEKYEPTGRKTIQIEIGYVKGDGREKRKRK